MPLRVFLSHSSKDKPQVEALAVALRERGIEPWLDKWEIGPGDDIVASINRGLDEADAGIIVFSEHSGESRWVESEVSYLTYARIVESKALIPVVLGEGAWVPPLIRPLARRGIEEADAISDALLNRRAHPTPPVAPEHGATERVLVSLGRDADGGVRVEVRIGDARHAGAAHPALPSAVVEAQAAFLRGVRAGVRRNPTQAERASQEAGWRSWAARCATSACRVTRARRWRRWWTAPSAPLWRSASRRRIPRSWACRSRRCACRTTGRLRCNPRW